MGLALQSTSSPDAEKLIGQFLADHYSGVLATADMAANPHGAVVYYLPDSDFSIYFATKEETQKFINMTQNEQVAFVVYDETAQTTLQIFGKVTIIDDLEKKYETIKNMTNTSLTRSDKMLPPAYKLDAGEYMVLQLVPQVMKMAVYSRSGKDEDIYEELIFG